LAETTTKNSQKKLGSFGNQTRATESTWKNAAPTGYSSVVAYP